VTNSLEADYVIWLDDAGVEAISFAPLSQQTGWARYFRESGTWAGVLVRFGFRRLPVLSAGAKAPIWVKEMAVTVTGDHDPLLSVVGDVPMVKFEAAVNEPRHYEALAAWLSYEIGVPIPDCGPWSDTPPAQARTQDHA